MKFNDIIERLTEAGENRAVSILNTMKAEERRKRSPRRPNSSRKMTEELRLEILALHERTDLTNSQIAARLNVNQGRVSEVINAV